MKSDKKYKLKYFSRKNCWDKYWDMLEEVTNIHPDRKAEEIVVKAMHSADAGSRGGAGFWGTLKFTYIFNDYVMHFRSRKILNDE